jgi:hypothetical protein
MALAKHAIESLYRRRAARYDVTANLYYSLVSVKLTTAKKRSTR